MIIAENVTTVDASLTSDINKINISNITIKVIPEKSLIMLLLSLIEK